MSVFISEEVRAEWMWWSPAEYQRMEDEVFNEMTAEALRQKRVQKMKIREDRRARLPEINRQWGVW